MVVDDDDDEFTIMKALNIKEFNSMIVDDNGDDLQ